MGPARLAGGADGEGGGQAGISGSAGGGVGGGGVGGPAPEGGTGPSASVDAGASNRRSTHLTTCPLAHLPTPIPLPTSAFLTMWCDNKGGTCKPAAISGRAPSSVIKASSGAIRAAVLASTSTNRSFTARGGEGAGRFEIQPVMNLAAQQQKNIVISMRYAAQTTGRRRVRVPIVRHKRLTLPQL